MGQLDYYDAIIRLTQEISGQKSMVGIPRIYIKITKNLSIGGVLSQVVFWGGKTDRPDGFFYKSGEQWLKELELSYHQITQMTNRLVDWGLIEKQDLPHNRTHKMHYRPLMPNIVQWILYYFQFDESPLDKLSPTKKYNVKIDLSPDEVMAHVQDRLNLDGKRVDPLGLTFGLMANGAGQSPNVAQPDGHSDWLEYREDCLKAYQAAFGEYLYPTAKQALLELAQEPDYNHELWLATLDSCALGGLKHTNITAMIDVYRNHGGNYQGLYDDPESGGDSDPLAVKVDDGKQELYKQMEQGA